MSLRTERSGEIKRGRTYTVSVELQRSVGQHFRAAGNGLRAARSARAAADVQAIMDTQESPSSEDLSHGLIIGLHDIPVLESTLLIRTRPKQQVQPKMGMKMNKRSKQERLWVAPCGAIS